MTQQLACCYAALILQELNKTDAASLRAVAAAAGVEVSQGMATAFSKALDTVSIAEVLSNMSLAGGAASAGAANVSGAAAPAAAKEAVKEEKPVEEEEDDEMGFNLFD
ncbi:unnamed protein product [Phytomonas sp. Hart1]|nr:unnamed protein product [Phytomonas sp. Hart1]|eukprot:CCW72032.1 unnamed protein product [Phytomonas sp. isolate Hart1]